MSDIRLSEKIGSAFYEVARDVFQHGHTHYDESGGRGSLKSSYVSIVVPLLLVQNPNTHALVLRKVANTIRDSFMRSTYGQSESWAWRHIGKQRFPRWS